MKLLMITILVGLAGMLVGCQIQSKRETPKAEAASSQRPKDSMMTTPMSTPSTNSQSAVEEHIPPAVDDNLAPDEMEPDTRPKPVPKLPKVGVIFGPGGGRVYGQIGVLQEFQKNKIPIYNVAGMEMGALVASLYAWRGSANDTEWQMQKIKGDDLLRKGIISGKRAGDFQVISSVIKSAFHNLKVEDFKKPFACPALNLEKNKLFVMNRGNLEAMLPYCLPYPPLFKPYQRNLAAVREVKALSDHLRRQGANYIVFINALGGNSFKTPINDAESIENLVWAETASQLVKESRHVDYTITLNLDSYGVLDFENKRDMMLKGAEQSNKSIRDLAGRLGL